MLCWNNVRVTLVKKPVKCRIHTVKYLLSAKEMISDFEDDTHYCLKCHSTIIGLDNYVNHRKSKCGKTLKNEEEITKPNLSPQLLQPDEPFSKKADDFFSSLELQSSAKKITAPSSGGKSFSGVLTRSKASAVIQASSSGKDHFNYLENTKNDSSDWISDHHMKSLDNDSIQRTDSLNRNHVKKDEQSAIQVYGDSDEESEEYEYDDEDSDYEDDDDNHDAPPRSYTGGKWKPTLSPVQWMRPSSSNEDHDWNSPPPHYTGAKWKPHSSSKTSDNVQPEHSGGKWKSSSPKESYDVPPPSFTGSKWTPSKIIPKNDNSDSKNKWKGRAITAKRAICEMLPSVSADGKWGYLSDPPPEHTKGKWKPAPLSSAHDELESVTPPPSYTKGKWKPTLLSPAKDDREDQAPPPSYTKGKWKPTQNDRSERPLSKWVTRLHTISSDAEAEVSPFRKSSGTVQYWCGPCNRRLASKIVYERHLKSELHFKRTLHDREFDDSSYLNINFVKNKRTASKSVEYCSRTDVGDTPDDSNNKTSTTSKVRRKIFVTCDVCKSRVNSQLMGKHLISHYHCRKGDINLPESRKIVLENIHSIILQSPYQCSPCKFYCNTHEWFLQHWLSESHKDIVLNAGSFFWCSVCKFQAENSKLMYDHLVAEEHTEMISVINRSVPVIIKKITPVECMTCNQNFLLNIQLRKHCERENHSHSLTCTDDYQNIYRCLHCDAVLKSRVAFQRHQILRHDEKIYICSVCSLNFKNIGEAKRHRSTPEHRVAVLEKRQKEGLGKEISKTCQYCSEQLPNILKLKEHLKEKHPNYNHSCPHCGKVFTIPQDLAVHIRTNACAFEAEPSKSSSCDQCQFKTDSTSELLFHKVLHSEPVMVYAEDQDVAQPEKRPIPQYKCPICQKFFVKSSLRCHLRIHTKERPFVCPLCNAGFVRKNNWMLHMKNHDRNNIRKLEKTNSTAELGDRPFLCSTCGASFKRRSILQQHMMRHTGKSIKCTQPGCVFSARFPAELKTHLLTHSDNKPFACDRCDYRGKTKLQLDRHSTIHEEGKKYHCPQCPFSSRLASHLKRHLRLHTGAKPYVCPHCDYCSNNLENLRKHVLSTSKHPGKSIYECKFCQGDGFETNFAKEFKVHLVTEHHETFVSGREATTYVAGIYEAVNDGTSVQGFLDADDKERNAQKGVLQADEALSQFQDSMPSVSRASNVGSAVLLTSVTTQDSSEHKIQDELFPMLIVSKDIVCIENPSESWNIGGSYDVEESGSLVPFHSEGETLFHEHFQ